MSTTCARSRTDTASGSSNTSRWTSLDPPLEAGGTGDAVIYNANEKSLEIVDLKGGRGVTVDVKGNPQGRSYAIGALLAFPELDVRRIRVTIVQPRVGDGKPKSDEFHVADLMDWTHDLLQHMRRAKQALDEFEVIDSNSVKFDEWAERWLTPGQCTFCTAKPICPALRKKALAAMPELARKWHEDTTLVTPPALSNLAKLGSPEELAHDLDGFDELEAWIKARRAFAHAEAERGAPPPGYGLVDKIGNRAWKEKDAMKLAALLREKLALSADRGRSRQAKSNPSRRSRRFSASANPNSRSSKACFGRSPSRAQTLSGWTRPPVRRRKP